MRATAEVIEAGGASGTRATPRRRTAPSAAEARAARRERVARRRGWNVLAHDIIPFEPSVPESPRHLHAAVAPRRGEGASVRSAGVTAPPARRHGAERLTRPTGARAPRLDERARVEVAPLASLEVATARADRRDAAARPTVAPRRLQRTRGLRRLLPGAATLAVFAGLWVGVGGLAGLHQPSVRQLPGAVASGASQVYVARPGDTLWSIAEAVEPNGDPRPLVADLEQQLHGAGLVPGDRLHLP